MTQSFYPEDIDVEDDDEGVCPFCHAAVDEYCDEDCPSWYEDDEA